jgi:hypothetical protein
MRVTGKSSKIMDKDLCDITRPPLSISEFHIHGKRKSTFPGTGNPQMKTSLMGKYWECKFKEKVVAKEVNEIVAKNVSKKGKEVDNGVRENPGLVFEEREGEDALVVDLMVAVWCAKTWCAETFEARMSKPTMAESESSDRDRSRRLIGSFSSAPHRLVETIIWSGCRSKSISRAS